MVVELNGFICPNNIGNKAKSLVDLNRYGFKVPTSIALDTNEYRNAIKNVRDKLNILLEKINYDNIEIISKQINILLEKIKLNRDIVSEIKNNLNDKENYILRSSIDGIDTKFTYAGLFPTRMRINKNNIEENIIECYKALFSYNSLYYMLRNNIDYSNISVAIIIQKEIKTDKLGYVTTMNPITLDTCELILEVEEHKNHEVYVYNYMKENIVSESEYNLLTKKRVYETIELINNIQSNLGYPIEIELAYTKSDIYVLQTRELTSILYENENSVWKKIDMSSKCFMFGLINDSYNKLINSFNEKLKLNSNEKCCELIFNHCYFNVLNISSIVNQFVDYDDDYFKRCFDLEKNIYRKNNFMLRLKRYSNNKYHELSISNFLDEYSELSRLYHQKYSEYCHKMSKVSAKEIEKVWLKLVFDDYKLINDNYINLKLLILIEKNILYKKLSEYISIDSFDNLIKCEELLFSYKIKKEFNKIVKLIKDDEDAYRYWFSSSINKIIDNYNNEKTFYFHKQFRNFIDSYGYLSYYKMDLSESFYVEDVEDVVRDIKKQLANFEPLKTNKVNRDNILKKLEKSIKPKKYQQLLICIERLQNLIVCESHLYDYLLRFNFIIKRYTKMLAKYYLTKKVIDNENDIWYLDIDTIYNYTEGEFDESIMKDKVVKAKLYYNSYRNITDITNIGVVHEELIEYDFKGIGYSTGTVVGQVKMIKSLKDLDTLTENDILVTKTINNNLLFQLPKIKGIVVSDPYLSNSVKDMIRELKVPCLMIDNCSKKLSDNMIIKMDCKNGLVKLLKKRK